MPRFLQNGLHRLKAFWSGSSLPQRALVAGLLASAVLVFILLMVWLNQPTFGVLYSNLAQKDASRVVQMLKKQNVPYKLTSGGTTVLVPEKQIYDLRLQLAGENALQGQGVGFEIFNKSQIGQTDFVQQVNYQRALQGELARTIAELPQVSSARVHLVLPEKSLFIEEQNPATASVLLNLQKGKELAEPEVESIVNVVRSAVEGLTKDSITVADTQGNLLYQPDEEGFSGLSSKQLEYKSNLERLLQNRIQRMLAPVVGADSILAKVNTELDLSKRTIRKEIYDPDSAVVRSEKKSRERSSGTTRLESGSPGPAYQGEQAGQNSGNSREMSRSQQTTNFEINKEERQVVVPEGQVERISVAVVVDGSYKQNQSGEAVFVPRSQEELDKIRGLVQNAIGYDSARGDSIEVASMPFQRPEAPPEPGLMDSLMKYAQRFWKPLLNAVIVLLFLFLVVRPIVLALIRPQVSEEESAEVSGLPQAEERAALGEADSEEEAAARESKKRFDDLKERAAEIFEQNRDEGIHIVKQWLYDEGRA